jgi:hypothetical protein
MERFQQKLDRTKRWIQVAYLVLNGPVVAVTEAIKFKPDSTFYNVIAEHMGAYLQNDQMPPDEIASAILNLADDHMSGRQMTLRAGDYIAIQNFIRKAM